MKNFELFPLSGRELPSQAIHNIAQTLAAVHWKADNIRLTGFRILGAWLISGLLANGENWLTLAGALDSPGSVQWSTSEVLPFVGRADPGAKGGSSAYINIPRGESSWLEATVTGPGTFDFWIREVKGRPLGGSPWNYWAITIDGVPVPMSGTSWPAISITGEGEHRIRFTFTNPTYNLLGDLASSVDEVSWAPLTPCAIDVAGGSNGLVWRTGKKPPAQGFLNTGRHSDPALHLTPGRRRSCWISTEVRGPCELIWDSSLDESNFAIYSQQLLQVDGMAVLPITPHSWRKMRLTLPKGTHTVRWSIRPIIAGSDRDDDFATWKLGGMKLIPGVSPLARALDCDAIHALETTDVSGRRSITSTGDGWIPNGPTSIQLFHPEYAGKFRATWRRNGLWTFRDGDGSNHLLEEPGNSDHELNGTLRPGEVIEWRHGLEQGWTITSPMLMSFRISENRPKDLAAAIESPVHIETKSWLGLPDPAAKTQDDSAWSMVNNSTDSHSAEFGLNGPSKVRFWWKSNGRGDLSVSLDGLVLPVAEPGKAWTQVEFSIGSPGPHQIRWKHRADDGTTLSTPGEAWLDGLKVTPETLTSLTEAATTGLTPVLENVSFTPRASLWQPVSYREPDGSWTSAARVSAGRSALRTLVTGPAVLEFRGRCFDPPDTQETSTNKVKSNDIIVPDPKPIDLEHLLAVDVDSENLMQISADSSREWKQGSVWIPEGVHEVNFRLRTRKEDLNGEFIVNATASKLQGWVDDVRIVSQSEHFTRWMTDHGLSDSSAKDADGDGESNFIEYALGTDPNDRHSKPPKMEMGFAADWSSKPGRVLWCPYLPAHSSAVLESSTDFKTWKTDAATMVRFPPLKSQIYISPSNSTRHAVAIPEGAATKFYRFRIPFAP